MDTVEKPEAHLIPALPDNFFDGRDEMNFAEFPLGTMTERVDPTAKTLVFQDEIFDKSQNMPVKRTLTITSSDAHGLPTSVDDEVLLGLIQLSKLNKFQSRKVYFSRYQLLKLLRWPFSGQSYARIDQALNRWIGVTLYYDNAWRDKTVNKWVSEKFHVLDNVKVYQEKTPNPSKDDSDRDPEIGASYFIWNETVFRSFEHGNIKALDYDFVLGLQSTIGRRLYRFLDKRFYHTARYEISLKTLACEHVGLSRNTALGDLKRKLGIAIEELERKGFLKLLSKDQRFRKIRPGEWMVIFEKGVSATNHSSLPAPMPCEEPTSIEQKLIACGIKPQKAKELAGKFDASFIDQQIS